MTPRRAGGPPSPDPMPAIATAVRLPWDAVVEDPVAALAEARSRIGDTFVVDSGGDRYLFLFSPLGVAALYGLPEEEASKGVADWRMLRRKLPDEVFDGRRVLPHQLFGREDVAAYLRNVEVAVEAAADELGAEGEVDLFALSRRLGHRVGLASWGGPGAAEGERFETLVRAFDQLDGAESFVHPDAMAHVAATGKAEERQALAVRSRRSSGSGWTKRRPGETEAARTAVRPGGRRLGRCRPAEAATGVCLDVTLIHVASMSNLFAALGWHLVDLVEHPDEAEQVRLGDAGLAETCALESTRMAQRSIMARFTLAPVTMDLEQGPLDDPVGHDRRHAAAAHEPECGARARPVGSGAVEPSQAAHAERLGCRRARHGVRARWSFLPGPALLLVRHDPDVAAPAVASSGGSCRWSAHPEPVRAQIGGVARSAAPCRARYWRR